MAKEMINNMIFDLQRFVDKEAYVATSSNEEITLSEDSVKSKKEGATVTTTLKPKTKGAPHGGVKAGAGNDSITVSSGVENMSIYGGRNNDVITIDSGAGGNKYIYESGDGQDTIYGWKTDDTLIMTSAYETAMSADGNDLLVKIGSGYVALKDVAYGSNVKVSLQGTDGIKDIKVQKLMQGTQRSESIYNTDTTLAATRIHEGSDSNDYWKIEAGAGNDSITNIFNNVSINAGADQDKIFIRARNNSEVTSGVTIRGGAGNDTIDVSADTIESGTSGGHVYEFGASDGYDSIIGFNANDTIHFIGLSANQISGEVNVKGNFIITAGSTVITIVKPENKELGGTKLNVYTKTEGGTLTPITSGLEWATAVNQAGTNNFDHYEIPKNILLSNSSETLNYGTGYDNYTVNAQGGADKLTISGKAMSINGGSSNDSITITGGTNVNTDATGATAKYTGTAYALLSNTAFSTVGAVTIQAGYGNDYIDATNDTIAINDNDLSVVKSAHVYQITNDSGRDSIFGFNEYDTIQIMTAGITASNITTRFDTTGKFFILKVGTAEVYLDVTQDYFKGGKTLNIIDSNGAAIAGLETSSGSAAPLEKVEFYFDNATGKEVDAAGSGITNGWKYIVPRVLQGTAASDKEAYDNQLVNTDDNFTINALQGDDEIVNVAASNVSISGYHGNDTIWLTSKPSDQDSSETVYGEGVTINGGLGNDVIYNEYVTLPSGTSTITNPNGEVVTVAADDGIKSGHTYTFGYNDGHDTIHFFGEEDTIAIDDNSSYVGSSVSGDDLIIQVCAKNDSSKRITATITLKEFVKGENGLENTFYLKEGTADPKVEEAPRKLRGTTGSDVGDSALTNAQERFNIEALAGNDSITNTGAEVTIDGGLGNDSIVNSADYVSINAGYGNDRIILEGSANNNTIIAGVGNDIIYNKDDVSAQTYVFAANEGTNYILNFKSGSTIQTTNIANNSDDIKATVTSEGYVITLKNSTTIIIKGELITENLPVIPDPTTFSATRENAAGNANAEAEWAEYDEAVKAREAYINDPKNYAMLPADTVINLSTYDAINSIYVLADNPLKVPSVIIGTDGNDTAISVADSMPGYKVDAKAGNDKITSSANNVSINGGIGHDTITLNEEAENNTILAGEGNDVIYGNGVANTTGKGNTYQYAVGHGNDTIFGYSSFDTISISGAAAPTATMTANGYQLTFSDGGTILLKDIAENTDKVHLVISNGTNESNSDLTIDKIAYGTNISDKVTIGAELVGVSIVNPYNVSENKIVTMNSDFVGYEYRALTGNDEITIKSDAESVNVVAGDGNDFIKINGGQYVTITPGFGDDSIQINPDNTDAHVFVFDAQKQGVNVIEGINFEDVIYINVPNVSIASAEFDADDYFVLTLTDNSTKIKLKGSNGTDYAKLGSPGAAGSFKFRYAGETEEAIHDYEVPNIIKITDEAMHVISEKAVVLGDSLKNDIVIRANDVSVDAGAGNDRIEILSGEGITITGGKGNDTVKLLGDGQVYNYAKGDGNDKISGWSSGNILNISGFTNYGTDFATLMTGAAGDVFAISLSSREVITFEDVHAGDDTEIILIGEILNNVPNDIETEDIMLSDGSTKTAVRIQIPKEIKGNDYANELTNDDGYDFKIDALAGHDTIKSSGDRVSIKGGAGNDSIVSERGNAVTILGGADNDTITVSESGSSNDGYSSIHGGSGTDVISLGSGVEGATVTGGRDNDTIFGNSQGNVFTYNSGDGDDVIYGFHSQDTLKLIGVGVKTHTIESGQSTLTVADTDVTADGLVIKLNDNSTLTLKGMRKDEADENTKDSRDFQFLNSQDSFVIITDNGNVNVQIDNVKAVTNGDPFENHDSKVKIKGVANDTITNYSEASNVIIEAGGGKDSIVNMGNYASINGGAGIDVIYLGNSYTEEKYDNGNVRELRKVWGHEVGYTDDAAPAVAVTVNAGTGNDTIYGNYNGDNDTTQAHVYQYKRNDGKDVIYNFGANDSIDLQGSDYDIDIVNIYKEQYVTAADKILAKTDGNGDTLYSYAYANSADTAETTSAKKNVATIEKKDGTGHTWYIKVSETRPIDGNEDEYDESNFIDKDDIVSGDPDYQKIYKYTVNGTTHYTTNETREITTNKETDANGKQVYFKTEVVNNSTDLAAYNGAGKAPDDDDVTTVLDEAATKIYRYYDLNDTEKYTSSATVALTISAAKDGSDNAYYVIKGQSANATTQEYTFEQISTDASKVATLVKTYWENGNQKYTTENKATVAVTAYSADVGSGSSTQVYVKKDESFANGTGDEGIAGKVTNDLAQAATAVNKYTQDGTNYLLTTEANVNVTVIDGSENYWLKSGVTNINDGITATDSEYASSITTNQSEADNSTPLTVNYYYDADGVKHFTMDNSGTTKQINTVAYKDGSSNDYYVKKGKTLATGTAATAATDLISTNADEVATLVYTYKEANGTTNRYTTVNASVTVNTENYLDNNNQVYLKNGTIAISNSTDITDISTTNLAEAATAVNYYRSTNDGSIIYTSETVGTKSTVAATEHKDSDGNQYYAKLGATPTNGTEYAGTDISINLNQIVKLVYSYTDENGNENYTNQAHFMNPNDEATNGSGAQWYLRADAVEAALKTIVTIADNADDDAIAAAIAAATAEQKAAAIAKVINDKKNNWTTTASEAYGYSDDSSSAPLAIKYVTDKDGTEIYTTEATYEMDGEVIYIDGWSGENNKLDDPLHKDVIIKVGSGSITLKDVEVDKEIHIVNYGTGHSSIVEPVAKIHKLQDNEGISEKYTFKNASDGYTIRGTAADEYVLNTGKDVYLGMGAGGANVITNEGENSSIEGSSKADTIINKGENVSIDAGSGANVITNYANASNTTILTHEGADQITNKASGVEINAGAGANVITNNGDNTNIITGANADVITNSGENVLITSGDGDDTIELGNSAVVSVQAGKGTNLIRSNTQGGKHFIYRTDDGYGTDYIEGWEQSDRIHLFLDTATEKYTTTAGGDGFKIIISDKSTDAILGQIIIAESVTKNNDGTFKTTQLPGNLTINIMGDIDSSGDYEELEIAKTPLAKYADNSGNIDIASGEDSYTANGTDAVNVITNNGYMTNILAGANNDIIYNSGEEATIDGGAGDDLIVFTDEAANYNAVNKVIADNEVADVKATINGGLGNDTIIANDTIVKNERGNGVVYNYTEGDGNDVIKGYANNDTIQVTGPCTTTIEAGSSDNKVNFIINVGTGSIKLLDLVPAESEVTLYVRADENSEYVAQGESDGEGKIIVPYLVNPDATTHIATASSSHTYIKAAAGNISETINVESGNNVTVDADGGADQINIISKEEKIKVIAGAGNDTIIASEKDHSRAGIVYVFGANDGNNLIKNFSENDTIQYTGGEWNMNAIGATLLAVSADPGTDDNGDPLNQQNAIKDLILTLGNTKVTLEACGGGGNPHDSDAVAANSPKIRIVDTTNNEITLKAGKIIPGTDGGDRLNNDTEEMVILGYGGRDVITNTADSVDIDGGKGDDNITNSGKKVTIKGGDDNDSITTGADEVSIDGGKGTDYVTISSGIKNTIVASAGTDYITINDNTAINEVGKGFLYEVSGEAGNLYINGFTKFDTIKITADTTPAITTLTADQAITSDDYFIFKIGETNLYIKGAGAQATDTITIIDNENQTATTSVVVPKVKRGTSKADVILSYEDAAKPEDAPAIPTSHSTLTATRYTVNGYYVDAQSGDDFIVNDKTNVTINANNGNDTITNLATGASLAGGSGNDSIFNAANDVTIFAGGDADTIENEGTTGVVYRFARNNGNTTIKGSKALNGTLYFPDLTAASLPSSSNLVINEKGTQMTLTTSDGNTIVFENSEGSFNNNSTIHIKYGEAMKALVSDYFLVKGANVRDGIEVSEITTNTAQADTGKKIYKRTYNNRDIYTTTSTATINLDRAKLIGGGDAYLPSGATLNPASLSNLNEDTSGTPVYVGIDGEYTTDTTATNVTFTEYTLASPSDALKPGSRQLQTTYYYLKNSSTASNDLNLTSDVVAAGDPNASTTQIYTYSYNGKTYYTTNRNNVPVQFVPYTNSNSDALFYIGTGSFNPEDTGNIKTAAEITALNENTQNTVTGKPIYIGLDGAPTLASTATVTATVYTTNNFELVDNKDTGLTINASSGAGTITNTSAKSVVINATNGAKNIINNANVSAAADAVTITTGSSNDTITNSSDTKYSSINAGGGNDTIQNSGTNVNIDAGAGNDTIDNKAGATDVTIMGGSGSDTIINAATNVTINAGNDNDYIKNSASTVSIFGGAGDDTIENSAVNVTLYAGTGKDLIKNTATYSADTDKVVYYFGSNNENTTIEGFNNVHDVLYYERLNNSNKPDQYTSATINSDYTQVTLSTADSNTVVIKGTFANSGVLDAAKLSFKVQLGSVASGEDTLTVEPKTIRLTDTSNKDGEVGDNYTSQNNNVTVNAGSGNDTITNTATGVFINANGGGVKKIVNQENSTTAATPETAVTISTGSSADTIENSGSYASIYAGSGENLIINTAGSHTSITGGSNVDKFTISGGTENYFTGGSGDDEFTISGSSTTTNSIYGGAGNDKITIESNAGANVFYYKGNENAGADTITGFGTNDTIFVDRTNTAISATFVTHTEYTGTDDPTTTEDERTATEVTDGVRFTIGSNTTVYLKGKTSGNVEFNLNGTAKTWTIGTGFPSANIAENNYVMDDVFGDDSDTYTTDNANDIDSIDYLNTSNFSAGNIENGNFTNLVQGNDATSATFGQDDDKQ